MACNLIRFQDAKVYVHAARAKIVTSISMSGSYSNCHCLPIALDIGILDDFLVFLQHRRLKNIAIVFRHPPKTPWVKVNIDDPVMGLNGILKGQCGTFVGGFSSNLVNFLVFNYELQGLMLAMELAVQHKWNCILIEGDSTSVILAFKKPLIVPYQFRNYWHNYFHLRLQVILSLKF